MSAPPPRRGRIVAELGRAETEQETVERKLAARRQRRANQTSFNLVVALIASLAIVAFLVVVVVRPDQQSLVKPVDWRATATRAQGDATVRLVRPALPGGWTANRAEYTAASADGVSTWAVGFVTPQKQYAAFIQGIGGTDAWVVDQLARKRATGSTTIAGVTWTVYDHREEANPGNLAYALEAPLDGSRVLLSGTASDAEFRRLAAAIVTDGRNPG